MNVANFASLPRAEHVDDLWTTLTGIVEIDPALKDELFRAIYTTVCRNVVRDRELLADLIALAATSPDVEGVEGSLL